MHDPAHDNVGVQPDTDINSELIGLLMVGFIVMMAGIFLVMHSLFLGLKDETLHTKIYGVENPALLELRTQEAQTLGNYKVLDKEKGRYQIPIAEAMTLTVRDMAAKKPAAAPVEAPAPVDGAAPTGDATGTTAPAGDAAAPAPAGTEVAPAGGTQ